MITQLKVTIKTTEATLTYAEMGDIVVDSEEAVEITLPAPNNGLWYRISSVGEGEVTISHGELEITTLAQNENVLLIANGATSWWYSK
jgi:hypothetical protein